MRILRFRVPAALAAALLASTPLSCGKSVTAPGPAREFSTLEWSFERDGQPPLEGWRIGKPSLASLVRESPPGGGEWSLELVADWAPTLGFVTRSIPGIRSGDILRLSALVRSIGEGGGSIMLSVGPGYGRHWNLPRRAYSTSTSWTLVSVQDTVSLAPSDSLWVTLSSFNTEIVARRGLFDLVTLKRIGRLAPAKE
jgi:hypothetical protein